MLQETGQVDALFFSNRLKATSMPGHGVNAGEGLTLSLLKRRRELLDSLLTAILLLTMITQVLVLETPTVARAIRPAGGTLSGQVFGRSANGSLMPLMWARVSAYENDSLVGSITTGANGNYAMSLPSGRLNVTVQYPGFKTQARIVSISEGDLVQLDFYLERATEVTTTTTTSSFSLSTTTVTTTFTGSSSSTGQATASMATQPVTITTTQTVSQGQAQTIITTTSVATTTITASVTSPVTITITWTQTQAQTTLTTTSVITQPVTTTVTSPFTVSTTTTSTVLTSPTPSPQRLCIIATAAYGSELAPQVQALREARDRKIMATFAGTQFMRTFDRFYYSFSPQVAETITSNPTAMTLTRILLAPLIQILKIFVFIPSVETEIILGGLIVSTLFGITYLAMPILLIVHSIERRKPRER